MTKILRHVLPVGGHVSWEWEDQVRVRNAKSEMPLRHLGGDDNVQMDMWVWDSEERPGLEI